MVVGKKVNDHVIKPLADLRDANLSGADLGPARRRAFFWNTTMTNGSIKNPTTLEPARGQRRAATIAVFVG